MSLAPLGKFAIKIMSAKEYYNLNYALGKTKLFSTVKKNSIIYILKFPSDKGKHV